MKKKLLVVGLCALSTLCFSEETSAPSLGYYLGSEAGYGGLQTPTSADPGISIKRLGIATRVELGHTAEFHSFQWGPEIGYTSYKTNSYTDSSKGFNLLYEGYTLDLLETLRKNITNHWHIIGKAGAAYNAQKTILNTTSSASETEYKITPELVASIGYNFKPNFSVDLSEHWISGNAPSSIQKTQSLHTQAEVAPVRYWSIGVIYTFQ